MVKLNLETKDKPQERIKAYLESNASEILADKINNGTPFEKDGKQLINRKDLDGFMDYANSQVLETIAKNDRKGTVGRCINDDTVYGWAIHYFEEDSIEGKLYNPDGTEYKPPVSEKTKTPTPIPVKPVPPKPKEPTLFDMIAAAEQKAPQEQITECKAELVPQDEPTIDQIANSLQQALDQKQHPVEPTPQQPVEQKPKNPLYEKYKTYTDRYPDSVIAMRVGDFYEVFGKKATLIADKANLTLTGRDLGLEQRIPMVGFPYHAAEAYFKKIRQSYSLVIVDGDEVHKLNEFGIEDIIDGDNELTDEEEQLIDDDLSVEEMAQFDGDIQEPSGIPERVLTDEQKQSMKYVLTKDDIVSDPSVLKRLHEILGDVLA